MHADDSPFPPARSRVSVETRLDTAQFAAAQRGRQFTPLRRAVYALILRAEKPLTAYELLDRLRETHRAATPATVYRTLDFLLEGDLIHKVESLGAFIPCADAGHRDHSAQFFICRACGAVAETEDAAATAAIAAAAARLGFTPASAIVEVQGLCAACRKAP